MKFSHNPHDVCAISSGFGPRDIGARHSKFHKGIDILPIKRGTEGDNLYATDDGIVRLVTTNKGGVEYGYGYYIIIEYPQKGYCALYGHLRGLGVVPNTKVGRGDIVAVMGNTGESTGPHCHFEVRFCEYPDFWATAASDPELFLLYGGEKMTKAEAIQIVQEKTGLSNETIDFLDCYKYAETLFIKIATALLKSN